MTTYTTTPVALSVHPSDESPVYSERATHVRLEDDGAGPFILLKQCHPEMQPGEVRLDLQELEVVLAAAQQLLPENPSF